MQKRETRTDLGMIRIHKNVIASIASLAAAEIEGVKDNVLTIELSNPEKGKSGTEYASLIGDVIRGDKSLFPSFDEVRASWEIIESIEKMRKDIPLVIYPEGSSPKKTFP